MKKSRVPDKKQDEAVLQITAHYVEQAKSGGRPSLSDYLIRYPDYIDAIVNFVVYYHALEEHISQRKDVSAANETFSEVSRWALEYARRYGCLSRERGLYQIPTLLVRRDRRRLSLTSLAAELDLSVDVVMQLEQRRIDPTSIPLELSRHLARILQQPLSAIRAYFAENSPCCLSGRSTGTHQKVAERQEVYAASAGEGVQRLSFHQALMASVQMSERQKAIWCGIIEHEHM
ncbi:MAG: hypothetical protein JO215_02360 [Ktedonobacteraceae bacterium]|nr:hypothetical protein [Ktedonobacteraceae bacterium]